MVGSALVEELSRDGGYVVEAPRRADADLMHFEQDQPDDYVLATGELHTVREFAGFDELVREMVEADMALVKAEAGGRAAELPERLCAP